jgi:hypothetical protein
MDLLLDTHTLLWWVDDAPQLSAMARKAIMEADGFVYVSLTSVWELAIKVSLGKLRLALPVKQYVPYHLTRLRLRPTRHVILFGHSRWSKPLDLSPDTMANHRPTGGRLATPDHGTLAFKPTAIMGSVEIS